MEFNRKLMDKALKNNIINQWEYNFCSDVIKIERPSIKQANRLEKILNFIDNPDNEDKIKKNKFQDEISQVVEIERTSEEGKVFLEGYSTDAKIGGVWFRKCETCERIKKKETEYRDSWRKNRKSSRGGQVTYSKRCSKCEDDLGHRWGDTNIKVE